MTETITEQAALPDLTYEDICALDSQSRYGRSEASMQLAVRRILQRHDHLSDLRERLLVANQTLTIDSLEASTDEEHIRLAGKAEGVRLALSYLEEYLR